jgi:oxaloacetate decarboxylase alpha subunit
LGTQAVINILSGERYKTVTKETAALLKGEYGATPAPVDVNLQENILEGGLAVTCRPADLLGNDEFNQIKESFKKITHEKKISIKETEENILTYALFPEVGIKFFENIDNADYFEKPPLEFVAKEDNFYNVSIDGNDYMVKYTKADKPEILNKSHILKKNTDTPIDQKENGEIIRAPLSGNIFSIIKNKGECVVEDDTIIVLEAMKMETTIKTPHAGEIINIFVSNGDKVNVGDPLFEVV